jgi:urea transport system ATP-binding protein
VARGLAYVPQGRQIFGTMTVKENIETGRIVTGKTDIPAEIFELFPILREFARRRGGNLSGGQQQQLAIARALASEPKVLLLDEPTEGIQPSIIKDIARLLRQIRDLHNICILVCEQVLSFVLDIADRILVMEGGRIVHTDTREHVNEAEIARFRAVGAAVRRTSVVTAAKLRHPKRLTLRSAGPKALASGSKIIAAEVYR